jgi:hypothetical protein
MIMPGISSHSHTDSPLDRETTPTIASCSDNNDLLLNVVDIKEERTDSPQVPKLWTLESVETPVWSYSLGIRRVVRIPSDIPLSAPSS